VSKVANYAIDLPDANVAIETSGTFGSRQKDNCFSLNKGICTVLSIDEKRSSGADPSHKKFERIKIIIAAGHTVDLSKTKFCYIGIFLIGFTKSAWRRRKKKN
jgi:hypothetical protein